MDLILYWQLPNIQKSSSIIINKWTLFMHYLQIKKSKLQIVSATPFLRFKLVN